MSLLDVPDDSVSSLFVELVVIMGPFSADALVGLW